MLKCTPLTESAIRSLMQGEEISLQGDTDITGLIDPGVDNDNTGDISLREYNNNLREIPAQPHGGEVAPPQLPDHVVPVVEEVPYLDRVVTT